MAGETPLHKLKPCQYAMLLDIEASEQTAELIPELSSSGTPVYADRNGTPKYLTDSNGDYLHPTLMYSCIVKVIDMNQTVSKTYTNPDNTVKTVQQYAEIYTFRFRKYSEVSDLFISYNQWCMKYNTLMYVFIHNLPYEMNCFIHNLAFFDIVPIEPKGCIVKSSTHYPQLQFGYLQFRDTLELTGLSIKKLGKQYGVHKLEDDYAADQTPDTPISAMQWSYNERDVDIINIALHDVMHSFPWLKPDNLPCTATGLYRKNNKLDPSITDFKTTTKAPRQRNALQFWNGICNIHYPKTPSEYKAMKMAYKGGFVWSNDYYCGKVLKNVHSIDAASMYPATPLAFMFPRSGLHAPLFGADADQKLREIVSDSVIHNTAPINKLPMPKHTPFDSKTGFIALVTFHNISVRRFKDETSIFPLIPLELSKSSKNPDGSQSLSSLCDLDIATNSGEYGNNSGKLIQAPVFMRYLTDVDLKTIQLTYTWDSMECHEIRTFQYDTPVPYLQNMFTAYGKQKAVYKKLVKHAERGKDSGSGVDITEQYVLDALQLRNFPVNEYAALSPAVQYELAEQWLRLSKNGLNGQYGINVQDLLMDVYALSDTDRHFHRTEGKEERKARECVLKYQTTHRITKRMLEMINRLCDTEMTETDWKQLSTDEQESFCNRLYHESKYMDLQKPADQNLTKNHRKTGRRATVSRSYLIGLYITAYARYILSHMAVWVLRYGGTVAYTDTDSLKFFGLDTDVLNQLLTFWKQRIDNLKSTLYPPNTISGAAQNAVNLDFNFGEFDFEHTYSDFCTLGCKDYVCQYQARDKNGKTIVATEWKKSGLPAAGAIAEKLIAKAGGFQEFVNRYYHFNTVIHYDVIHKLMHYSDWHVTAPKFYYTDAQGNTIEYHSGTILRPQSMSINVTDEDAAADHAAIDRLSIRIRGLELIGNTNAVTTAPTVITASDVK